MRYDEGKESSLNCKTRGCQLSQNKCGLADGPAAHLSFTRLVLGTNTFALPERLSTHDFSKSSFKPRPPAFFGAEQEGSPNKFLFSKNFPDTLIFLRSNLIPWLNATLMERVIVASRFLIFVTIMLQRPHKSIIVDGSRLRLNDWRAERVNVFRALVQQSPYTRFLLISTVDLSAFAFREQNLSVVRHQLSAANANEILTDLLREVRSTS